MRIHQVKIRAVQKMIAELRNGMYVDENSSAAVFCTDNVIRAPEVSKIPNCRLQFTDTENPEKQDAITREQAKIISDFILALPDRISTLYCCCDWGQSRSAGLAAACMHFLGQDYISAFENSSYSPNLLVYSYMCEAFGLGLPGNDEIRQLRSMRLRAAEALVRRNRLSEKKLRFERIIITGCTDLFVIKFFLADGKALVSTDLGWSPILEEKLSCPVVNRASEWQAIPQTEKELIADRRLVGAVNPSDLVVVMFGVSTPNEDNPEGYRTYQAAIETAEMMRRYLIWLKYVIPGINLLLVSPFGIEVPNRQMAIRKEECDDVYREIAEELKIHYIDSQGWEDSFPHNGNSELPHEGTKRFAEYLAERIMELQTDDESD